MRLMTEFGPRPRSAGRYWGNCAEAGVAEGEPAGFAEGEPAGCDALGVAEGFVCTCTSAAKMVSAAIAAAVRANQNLNIECLRNAVMGLTQDQLFDPGSPNRFQLFPVGLVAVRIPVAWRSYERMRPYLRAVAWRLIFDAALLERHWRPLQLLDRRRVRVGPKHLERSRTTIDRRFGNLTFSLRMQGRRVVGSWRQMINDLRPGA